MIVAFRVPAIDQNFSAFISDCFQELKFRRLHGIFTVLRRQFSSVVEQRFCKPSVLGSNPRTGSNYFCRS